jgi:hypothetical protein
MRKRKPKVDVMAHIRAHPEYKRAFEAAKKQAENALRRQRMKLVK